MVSLSLHEQIKLVSPVSALLMLNTQCTSVAGVTRHWQAATACHAVACRFNDAGGTQPGVKRVGG